ncbi:MAG: SDR family oxidoreductase [Candidatus Latescibacterota bacterium]|nr:SDR family oxidoreductase [Candidatus Latescibacterota bacterium]
MQSVLITGAAGRIGRILRQGLKDNYLLRLADCIQIEDPEVADVHVADVTNIEEMERICRGIDSIVHLAGEPSTGSSWPVVLQANIQGTYGIFEAARIAGVKRVIFASSNHTTGYYEKESIYTKPDMLVRPDSLYGVSKAFGEDLARFYVDEYGLSAFCLRIGSFQPNCSVRNRSSERILSTWLSHRDMVQLVQCCIDADSIDFGIYYGISNNTRAYWDTQNARDELGYSPEDDAEDFV